jgi:chemotaxis protein methyltransferase CheR
MRDESEIFKGEADQLIREIHSKYGYDFQGCAKASFYRRVKRFLEHKKLKGIPELKNLIFISDVQFESFLQEITVNVTEMFRDPTFFLSLRQKVVPILSTYPHIRIWDAGCSTGEELYSLAILLQEEGLLERTKIYATDINQKVLKKAKEGIFPAGNIQLYTGNYYAAGGSKEFSSYFRCNYGSAKFSSSLIKNVIFYPHNLATDFSFNEFHLILCRNVLIYFNKDLQERVLGLFHESLVSLGYLCLGKKETLGLSGYSKSFEAIDKENKIYRKRI